MGCFGWVVPHVSKQGVAFIIMESAEQGYFFFACWALKDEGNTIPRHVRNYLLAHTSQHARTLESVLTMLVVHRLCSQKPPSRTQDTKWRRKTLPLRTARGGSLTFRITLLSLMLHTKNNSIIECVVSFVHIYRLDTFSFRVIEFGSGTFYSLSFLLNAGIHTTCNPKRLSEQHPK
jgi:hypothetical protein